MGTIAKYIFFCLLISVFSKIKKYKTKIAIIINELLPIKVFIIKAGVPIINITLFKTKFCKKKTHMLYPKEKNKKIVV